MNKNLLSVFLISALVLISPRSAIAENEVTVSARAEVRVPSSSFILSITLKEQAANSADAVTALGVTRAAIEKKLATAAISDSSLFNRGEQILPATQKQGIASRAPQSSTLNTPVQTVITQGLGVEVRQIVGIRIKTLTQAAKLSDLALSAGADSVSLEATSDADPTAIQDAIVEATKIAEQKASKVAQTLGAKRGQALSIEVLETAPGAILRREMHLDPSDSAISEFRREVIVTARFAILNQ